MFLGDAIGKNLCGIERFHASGKRIWGTNGHGRDNLAPAAGRGCIPCYCGHGSACRRGKELEGCRELGINEYILSAIALGLEPGAHVYFQSGFNPVKTFHSNLA